MGKSTRQKNSVLLPLLFFRVLNAVLTKTFFQADEFWQSLEPAHFKAFGYGKLTWEWDYGLRSYAFPFLFECVYYISRLLSKAVEIIVRLHVDIFANFVVRVTPNSDFAWDMVDEMLKFPEESSNFVEYYTTLYFPKILMGILAAIGEFYFIKFVRKIYMATTDKTKDEKADSLKLTLQIASVLTLSNFFNCFLITRTYINSFEMILTSISLYYWDWTGGEMIRTSEFSKSLAISMLACLQRPTNAFIWISLGGFMILNLISSGKYAQIFYLFKKLMVVFLVVFAINAAIDFYFYKEMVFPVFRFIKFNFTSSLSKFYGVAPWHFHLLQSLPILLGYCLPFFVLGFATKLTSKRFVPWFKNPFFQFKFVIVTNMVVYSMISHKEFRFIYSLQPFLLIISTFSLLGIMKKRYGDNTDVFISNSKLHVWIFPTLSVIIALILCTFNESGTVQVINFLHQVPQIDSLGFIMPCHSTPWQSHLHRNDINDLWAITCQPPLHLLNDPDAALKLPLYMDESDYLYEDVPKFIYQHFPPVFRKNLRPPGKEYRYEWPEYLVIFEQLDNSFMKNFLKDSGYIEFQRFFNSWKHWDSRRSGDVIVYHKLPWN